MAKARLPARRLRGGAHKGAKFPGPRRCHHRRGRRRLGRPPPGAPGSAELGARSPPPGPRRGRRRRKEEAAAAAAAAAMKASAGLPAPRAPRHVLARGLPRPGGRARAAPPRPPPPGPGLHGGGVPGRGRGPSGRPASGWGQGLARAPSLCTCRTSPHPAVRPPWTGPPPWGWPLPPSPPAPLQPRRARRGARGGARGPPRLGPLRARPEVPTSCHSLRARAAGDGPGAPESPELPTRLTSPRPAAARSFRGRTMGDIARLRTESAWPQREGTRGQRPRGGAPLRGSRLSALPRRIPGPCPGQPPPCGARLFSRRKQRLIRYPRPASPRRGDGRVADGSRGGQRSGGARTGASRSRILQPGADTLKSHPGIFFRRGWGWGARARHKNIFKFPNCPFSLLLSPPPPSPVVQAKLKFQVRFIQLHPSGLTLPGWCLQLPSTYLGCWGEGCVSNIHTRTHTLPPSHIHTGTRARALQGKSWQKGPGRAGGLARPVWAVLTEPGTWQASLPGCS